MGGCDGTHSMAERIYPMSEARGRSWEDPMPEGLRPRGVTPRPRSGRLPGVPGSNSPGAAERSYPLPKARGSGREEQPHLQGAVATRVQEGLEELFHVQGQEGRW